jgi:hypothetical protein
MGRGGFGDRHDCTAAPSGAAPIKKGRVRDFFVEALANARPEALLQSLPSCKDATQRGWIIANALAVVAMHDAPKAEAWLKACSDPSDRRMAERAVRLGIVKGDPLRAIGVANSLTDRNDIQQVMATAAEQAAKMGSGALRQLATIPMNGIMLAGLLDSLASGDPELSVELALKNLTGSDSEAKTFCVQRAFTALAQKDPELAVAKLAGIDGPELAAAVSAVGAEWAAKDAPEALAWLMSKPESERRDPNRMSHSTSDSLLMAFSEWAAAEPGRARTWADSLPSGETRDKVQTQLARALADQGEHLAEATEILSRLGSVADPRALSDVASQWSKRDPQAAAAWAVAQPAGPLQTRALASVVGTWANDDSTAMQQWLAQFPPGEARDRSIAAFLQRNNHWSISKTEQIAEFDAWFDLIQDPWQRTNVASRIYHLRRQSDPEGARAWFSSLENLDPAVVRINTRSNEE